MLSHSAVDLVSKALSSPVFLSAFFSWLVAQVLKSCIMLARNRPRTAKEILLNIFWSTGGMPSSHSAVVSSLATSAAFEEGVTSTLFFVTLFYALLTFRDALGVRRSPSPARHPLEGGQTSGRRKVPERMSVGCWGG